MPSQYELTYFNMRGLAEPIRMILAYAEVDWKDNRIPHVPGAAKIPQEIKEQCLFGQVPLLEFEGQKLVQSVAICRFLARTFDLAGKDELESAKCDEIVDGVRDFIASFFPAHQEKDEAKKAEMMKATVIATKAKFMFVFNRLIEANGGYLVGNSMTWADILTACFIDSAQRIHSIQLMDDFSALQKHNDTVFNSTGIKDYVTQRPATKF